METKKEKLKAFQTSWAYHKYWVMLHSQKAYEEIRILAKDNDWNEVKQTRYEEILAACATCIPTRGSAINACLHVWGYVKKEATAAEKKQFFSLIESDPLPLASILECLHDFSIKYRKRYLINSKLFDKIYEENTLKV